MEILLTIAIPTIEERNKCFNQLYDELIKQSEPYGNSIEIIYLCDNREMTIGQKRQMLNNTAKGKYVVHWDDDDWICEGGIDLIMNGIKTNQDVISYDYSANIDVDNITNRNRKISINYKNELIGDVLYLTPDCKNPIKRDIIHKIKFKDTNWSEEYFFSCLLYTSPSPTRPY